LPRAEKGKGRAALPRANHDKVDKAIYKGNKKEKKAKRENERRQETKRRRNKRNKT
jgi:hypothetical protein